MKESSAQTKRTPISMKHRVAFAVGATILSMAVLPAFLETGRTAMFGSDSINAGPTSLRAIASLAEDASAQALMSKAAAPTALASPGAEQFRRHIAVSHSIELRPSSSPAEAQKAIVNACKAGCEVLHSTANEYAATISMRVEPDKAGALEIQLQGLGRISSHTQTATDKTGEVVDADARAKNLNVYRDKLREMIGTAPTTETLLTLNREMLNIQSQLDAAEMLRKSLRQETEKIQFSISLGSDEIRPARNAWDKLVDAVKQSGSNFLTSVTSLVVIAAYLAPYALLGAFAWFAYSVWARRRQAANDQA